MEDLQVGSLLWVFDGNRRVYDKKRNCIYSEHFKRVEVVGETSRSWLIASAVFAREQFKIPKGNPFPEHPRIYTDKMKEDDIWIKDHKYKIIHEIQGERSVDRLKKIADIMEYKS